MKPIKILVLSALLFSIQACAGTEDIGSAEAEDASFLENFQDGKSDAFGISEEETEAILRIVNTLSQDELDHDVALDARAARNIVDRRTNIGDFLTLEELDAVAYVGPTAFQKLREYAAANPIPEPASFCGDGVLEDGEACDDGNSINADGCSASCEIETVHMVTYDSKAMSIGGFRRFSGTHHYDAVGGFGHSVEYSFVALTPVSMRMNIHDGSGNQPMANFQRRYTLATGSEPAQVIIRIHSKENGSSQEISKTLGTSVELDLPAGEYVIRQHVIDNASSRYSVYKYDYQTDFEFTGDVDTCLRASRCDAPSYHLKKHEGAGVPYFDDVSSSATRVNGQLVYPNAYDFVSATLRFTGAHSREKWPVEIGKTTRFTGNFDNNRVKYFVLRLDRPTRLDTRWATAYDMASGGGYPVSISRKLYRHDITSKSIGQFIGDGGIYTLEPGDYLIEVKAGQGWGTAAADYTKFEVRFTQTAL